MSATETGIQSLDQRRARHAFACIEALEGQQEDDRDQYAIEAKRLPVRIMASGLGQALAFIVAKSGKRPGLERLHANLTDWVLKERFAGGESHSGAVFMPIADANSLLQSVVLGKTPFLQWATDETLAYLVWLNRFAEASGYPKKETP